MKKILSATMALSFLINIALSDYALAVVEIKKDPTKIQAGTSTETFIKNQEDLQAKVDHQNDLANLIGSIAQPMVVSQPGITPFRIGTAADITGGPRLDMLVTADGHATVSYANILNSGPVQTPTIYYGFYDSATKTASFDISDSNSQITRKATVKLGQKDDLSFFIESFSTETRTGGASPSTSSLTQSYSQEGILLKIQSGYESSSSKMTQEMELQLIGHELKISKTKTRSGTPAGAFTENVTYHLYEGGRSTNWTITSSSQSSPTASITIVDKNLFTLTSAHWVLTAEQAASLKGLETDRVAMLSLLMDLMQEKKVNYYSDSTFMAKSLKFVVEYTKNAQGDFKAMMMDSEDGMKNWIVVGEPDLNGPVDDILFQNYQSVNGYYVSYGQIYNLDPQTQTYTRDNDYGLSFSKFFMVEGKFSFTYVAVNYPAVKEVTLDGKLYHIDLNTLGEISLVEVTAELPAIKLDPATPSLINTTTFTAHYSLEGVDKAVTFNDLSQGLNELTLSDIDSLGRAVTLKFNMNVDSVAPVAVITSPALTGRTNYTFAYTVDGAAKTETVALVEGVNHISRTFTDLAGNKTIKTFNVMLDSTLPDLPVFSVFDFGAKGDGITDDTLAIRATMTAATQHGGIVYLPTGTYAVMLPADEAAAGGSIFNITTSNVVFAGDGSGMTKLVGYMPGMKDPATNWIDIMATDDYFKVARFSMFSINSGNSSSPHDIQNIQFRSLTIDGQAGWTGDYTVGSSLKAVSAAVSTSGSGYKVNDILTLGNTGNVVNNSPATFRVKAVSNGVVTQVELVTSGVYNFITKTPIAVTGGSGTGCMLTVANIPTGDGWDMTHKGIKIDGAGIIDDILILNCDIAHWRGEVVFAGGGDNVKDISIINSTIRSSNASAVSTGGNVLIDHSTIGGTDPADAVYNGTENFAFGHSGTTVRDSHIINALGNGLAFIGYPDTYAIVERTTIENSHYGILFSEATHNVQILDSHFKNNIQAMITSGLGLYPELAGKMGFDNFMIKGNTFDHSGAVIVPQEYGNNGSFKNLTIINNTITNGRILDGGFGGDPSNWAGFIVQGNTLGEGAYDVSNGYQYSNVALWKDNIRLGGGAIGWGNGYAYVVDDFGSSISTKIAPKTDITWLNANSTSGNHYAVIDAAVLKYYPAGFETKIITGALNWVLKADSTWNNFSADIVVPKGLTGVTIFMDANGKFSLVNDTLPAIQLDPATPSLINTTTFTAHYSLQGVDKAVTFNDLSQGLNQLTLSDTDSLGRAVTLKFNINVDSVAPVLVLDPATKFISNKNTVTINYTEDGVQKQATFDLTKEGDNTFNIQATDAAGNKTTQSVTITRDTIAPVVVLTSAIFTKNTSYTLTYTQDGVVKTETVTLVEGINHLTRTLLDAAGNSTTKIFDVTLDTIAPVAVQTSPALTKNLSYTLTYTLDGVAQTETVTLVEGANVISRTFTDLAGNSVTKIFNVTLDTIAPVITAVVSSAITQTSATINWTTNEASDSQVQYRVVGSTIWLSTVLNTSAVTNHSVVISGLSTGIQYEFKAFSKDALANQRISAISNFTTQVLSGNVINIDSNWLLNQPPGQPYFLNQAGKTYSLQQDVTVQGTAFVITARDIVLDLNGHTITYDNAAPISVPNGSFESSTGWDFSLAPGASRYQGVWLHNETYDGSYSLKFSLPNANQQVTSASTVTLEANTTYSLSAMFEYGGAGDMVNPGVKMYVRLVGTNGEPVREAYWNGSNWRGIQFQEGEFKTGNSAETYRIVVGVEGASGVTAASAFIDDIKIQKTHTYGIATQAYSWSPTNYPDMDYSSHSGAGTNAVIKNGTIIQGADGATWGHGIFMQEISHITIQNMNITVNGANSSAIFGMDLGTTASDSIHDNILTSNVRTVTSRDNGHGTVMKDVSGDIYNNQILNGPHMGITASGASTIHGNTIQLKGKYTNNFAIGGGSGSQIYGNTILCGTGEYSCRGIMSGGSADGQPVTKIYDNTVYVQGKANSQEYEGTPIGGAYGIQLENARNVEVYHNNVYAYGTETTAYAFRMNSDEGTSGVVYIHDNVFQAVAGAFDAASVKLSAIEAGSLRFEDNELITNDGIIGSTSDSIADFVRTKITINTPITNAVAFESDYSTNGPINTRLNFIDTVFTNTFSHDYFSNGVFRTPRRYGGAIESRALFSLNWSTTFNITDNNNNVLANATITIVDKNGNQVFTGKTDASGKVVATLAEFQTLGNVKTSYSPYGVTVTSGTVSATRSLTADQIKTVLIAFNPNPDVTPPIISAVASSAVTQNTAVISWTTNEVSDSQVQYRVVGSATWLSTVLNTSMVTNHSVTISGLTANSAYEYKVLSNDALANQRISAISNLTTLPSVNPNFITVDQNFITANLREGALLFNQAGKTYQFQADFHGAGTAIFVMASDVTIDLNGHTVFFGGNNQLGTMGINLFAAYHTEISLGKDAANYTFATPNWSNAKNLTVKNGSVKWEGVTGAWATAVGTTYGGAISVDNMHLMSGGPDGWTINGSEVTVSNTYAESSTSSTENRHQAPGNIGAKGKLIAFNNIVVGGNSALVAGSNSVIYNNILRQSGYATNGYGVFLYRNDNVQVYNNIMIPTNGRGVIFNAGTNHVAYDNLIVVHEEPNAEFGDALNSPGFRLRYDADNIEIFNNDVLSIGGGSNASGSGLYLSDNVATMSNYIHNNEFRAILTTPTSGSSYANAITMEGQTAPDVVENNIFSSNNYLIRTSGYDGGVDMSASLVNNTLQWVGGDETLTWLANKLSDPKYGFAYSAGNMFVNSALASIIKNSALTQTQALIGGISDNMQRDTFFGGYCCGMPGNITLIDTKLDPDVTMNGTDFTIYGGGGYVLPNVKIGHSLVIVAKDSSGAILANKAIMIRDSSGLTYTGTTDANGVAKLELIDYSLMGPAVAGGVTRVNRTGHQALITGFNALSVSLTAPSNPSNPFVLTFITGGFTDNIAPVASGFVPADGAIDIPATRMVSVDIVDQYPGVDPASIKLFINGVEVVAQNTAITGGFHVSYTPPQHFAYDQIIQVRVTAKDTDNNAIDKTFSFRTEKTPAYPTTLWDANEVIGDGQWQDSSVTNSVRLLVSGAILNTAANRVALEFQGRSSGNYQIKSVSIAEVDPACVGCVVDSTWTKVLFDGKDTSMWDDNVTVGPNSTKVSDALNFTIDPNKSYYISFKIVTPSVYLDINATGGYQELYYYNTDKSSQIDWTDATAISDYHAFSRLYAVLDTATL